MQSQVVAMFVAQGGRQATMLVRRGDGQFALKGIDARVASATRFAASCFPATLSAVCYEETEEPAA